MTTTQPTSHLVDVPGGRLYYEVRGSGPLLLVVGQPMTSEPFGPVADLLAQDRTVVTYDPHGLGKSTVEDPGLPVTPEVEADDLAEIVRALGAQQCDVFGTSGGAVAALAFAVAHPDLCGTVIAHEPPVPELLPDAAYIRSAIDDTEEAYRTGGSGAAWSAFISLVMVDGPVTEAGVPPAAWPPPGAADDDGTAAENATPPEPSQKQRADDELFFLRMLKPFTRYQPDVERLRVSGSPIVLAVGAGSGQEIARRSTEALAERLGTSVVELPGHHGGFMEDPAGFADAIRRALTSDLASSSAHS